jgi:hypothetical protein
VPTGAPAPRPGGYALDAEEAGELSALAADLESRPDPDAALSWAVARFEMGCSRAAALEGLSDHLLALRAVLEGHGPVGATLPMRAAALLAESGDPGERATVRERVEAALELERALMAGLHAEAASDLATWVEQSVRDLLRRAALGELGSDLGAAADESLIASGLAEGDADITVSAIEASPEMPDARPGPPGREAEDVSEFVPSPPTADDGRNLTFPEEAVGPASRFEVQPEEEHMHAYEHDHDDDTRIIEPVPAEDEIRITASDWLDEVTVEGGTLEWPAGDPEIGHRERIDSPRVRHLFQVPEDADWEVRELDYDHYRRAG